MSGVGMRARADLRSRLASVIVLTLATGIVGGAAMTAFAAARRTDSAYARFRQITNEPDAIAAGCRRGLFPPLDLSKVDALPMVSHTDSFVLINPVGALLADGRTPVFGDQDAFEAGLVMPAPTGAFTPSLRLMAGRLPERADEVALSWGPTYDHANIGDTIILRMLSPKVSPDDVFSGGKPPPGAFEPDLRMTVTGIILSPNDIAGDDSTILATQAFSQAHPHPAFACDARAVHLTNGIADLPAFGFGMSQIKRNAFYFDVSQESTLIARSTHLRAIVMRLFAWLVIVAGLLVLGQALIRRTVLGSTEDPILRALGMSRGQITRVAVVTGAIVGIGGAAVAAAVSILASPFAVTGMAEFLDADQGPRLDLFVVVVGTLAIVLVAIALTGIPAWRVAAARGNVTGAVEYAGAGRTSRTATVVATLGFPPSAVAGWRLALEPGHGRTAIPVRSAVAGLALTVAAMIAAFGFAASMRHFVGTPALWGITMNYGTGSPFSGDLFQKAANKVLRGNPAFSDLSFGNFENSVYVTRGGTSLTVNTWAISPVQGANVVPTMLEGRWPANDDEIALGATTLSRLGLAVGDTVHVEVGTHQADMQIVGKPVFPDLGFGPGFGQGAGMTLEGFRRFYPAAFVSLALGRFAPGVDINTTVDTLNETLRPLGAAFHPGDLDRSGQSAQDASRSQDVPLVLASLFTLSALATLVHVLITSVRRRRKDLAILRTLGFKRRQVASAVAWQSAVLAMSALVIGVPVGVLLGRLGWSLFATNLGVVSVPVIAWIPVLAAIPVTIMVAVLVSIGPALAARRTKPAMVLRAE
jgi:ABC-type lipoprotein release transport system permease subunit